MRFCMYLLARSAAIAAVVICHLKRGRDGGVREELAEGMTAAPAHEWFQVKGLIAARPTTHVRYRAGPENICSF
jgi:hypothetical protein